MQSFMTSLGFGTLLCALQILLALPWLFVLDSELFKSLIRKPMTWLALIGSAVVGGGLLALAINTLKDQSVLGTWGGVYGAILEVQVMVDLFVVVFGLLLTVWQRGAAVALAAFREGVRQPMFWLLAILAVVLMLITPFIPYFTFGEDFKMVKELGYDCILLFPLVFAILISTMSISEEIEGKTAITLMSKPVSRRQFLLGKFTGLLLASLVMTCLLTVLFQLVLIIKYGYDREALPIPPLLNTNAEANAETIGLAPAYFWRGMHWWYLWTKGHLPGVILNIGQCMILLATAVTLSTRLPMIVSLMVCIAVFFLGNLTPILVQASQGQYTLIEFMGNLFYTILPALDLFNLAPLNARDKPPADMDFYPYLGGVMLYSVMYTTIVLLLGLIFFEDRDLA